MTRGRRDVLVALACALAAVATSLLACFASQDGSFSPSALVKLSREEPMAAVARASDPAFTFVNPVEHYDGVYYYVMARDPLLHGPEHQLIDQAPYRYGHPMFGWLARVIAFGRPGSIPSALLALTILGAAVAAYTVSRLSVQFGRTPWGGLLVATSPGLLYAVTVSTTETVGTAFAALVLLAWSRRHIAGAAGLLVLLCLTKEAYVTVPAGLALWEAVEWVRRRTPPPQLGRVVVALAAGPLALAAWQLYVRGQLGVWPDMEQPGNVAIPVQGWLDTFAFAHGFSGGSADQSQIGAIVGPVLIAVAAVVLAASVTALRMRTLLDGVLLGMAVVLASLSYLTLGYPHELVRNPSVVLLLAIAVLLSRPAAGRTPPSPAPAAAPAAAPPHP